MLFIVFYLLFCRPFNKCLLRRTKKKKKTNSASQHKELFSSKYGKKAKHESLKPKIGTTDYVTLNEFKKEI